MDRLLQDIVGLDGAAAIERAVGDRPGLRAAVRPRVALSWAILALERGYRGAMPGSPGVQVEVLKHEGWAFESADLNGAGEPRPEQLATYLLALSGEDVAPVPRDRAMVRLGRNLDALAKAEFARSPMDLMRRSRSLAKAKGTEGPGPAAAARPPTPPQAPTAPTAPKKGVQPVAPKPPAAPMAPGGTAPKPPKAPGAPTMKGEAKRGMSLLRAEAEAPCPACDLPQVTEGVLTGCPCWSAGLEKAEAVATPLGFIVKFEDPEEGAVFIASVRHVE